MTEKIEINYSEFPTKLNLLDNFTNEEIKSLKKLIPNFNTLVSFPSAKTNNFPYNKINQDKNQKNNIPVKPKNKIQNQTTYNSSIVNKEKFYESLLEITRKHFEKEGMFLMVKVISLIINEIYNVSKVIKENGIFIEYFSSLKNNKGIEHKKYFGNCPNYISTSKYKSTKDFKSKIRSKSEKNNDKDTKETCYDENTKSIIENKMNKNKGNNNPNFFGKAKIDTEKEEIKILKSSPNDFVDNKKQLAFEIYEDSNQDLKLINNSTAGVNNSSLCKNNKKNIQRNREAIENKINQKKISSLSNYQNEALKREINIKRNDANKNKFNPRYIIKYHKRNYTLSNEFFNTFNYTKGKIPSFTSKKIRLKKTLKMDKNKNIGELENKNLTKKNYESNNLGNNKSKEFDSREMNKTFETKKEGQIKSSSFLYIDSNILNNIESQEFDIFELDSNIGRDNTLSLIGFYIFKRFGFYDIIDYNKFEKWCKKIAQGYIRDNPYHTDLHAADITHTCLIYFKLGDINEIIKLSKISICGVFLSCICHDYKHPGLNNNFLKETDDKLAIKYNDTSILENMHIAETFKLIQFDSECNIFEKIDKKTYRQFRKEMISCVLSTDMAFHNDYVNFLKKCVSEKESKNIEENTKKEEPNIYQNYMNILIHSADISNPTKPFNIYFKWAKLVIREFYDIGDKEKKLNLPCSCDREKVTIFKSQLGFINFIELEYFTLFSSFFPKLKFYLDNLLDNKNKLIKMQEESNQANEQNLKVVSVTKPNKDN